MLALQKAVEVEKVLQVVEVAVAVVGLIDLALHKVQIVEICASMDQRENLLELQSVASSGGRIHLRQARTEQQFLGPK